MWVGGGGRGQETEWDFKNVGEKTRKADGLTKEENLS